MEATQLRSRARMIGAGIVILGLGVLHWAGGRVFTGDGVITVYRLGVLALLLAAVVILVGLVLHDKGRSNWGMPLIQLGGVVVVLAFLPLLLASILGVRSDEETAPILLFAGICASLGIFVLVLGGQTKAEVDRALRRQ